MMEREIRRGRDREHTQDGTSVVEPFTNVPFLIYTPQKMGMVRIMVTTSIPFSLFLWHALRLQKNKMPCYQSSLSVTPSLRSSHPAAQGPKQDMFKYNQ